MMYVTLERTVRRRPDIVWSFLTDLDAATTWIEGLVELRAIDGHALDVTARLAVKRRNILGSIDDVISEITSWREPVSVALETRLAKVVLFHRVALTPIAEGTRLGVFSELDDREAAAFARAPGLAEPSRRELQIRGIYERSIDALVTRIEMHSAVPYR